MSFTSNINSHTHTNSPINTQHADHIIYRQGVSDWREWLHRSVDYQSPPRARQLRSRCSALGEQRTTYEAALQSIRREIGARYRSRYEQGLPNYMNFPSTVLILLISLAHGTRRYKEFRQSSIRLPQSRSMILTPIQMVGVPLFRDTLVGGNIAYIGPAIKGTVGILESALKYK